MFYSGAFGKSSYPPGCFLHLDFLDVEKHRELGSWWAPNPQGPGEASTVTVPRRLAKSCSVLSFLRVPGTGPGKPVHPVY